MVRVEPPLGVGGWVSDLLIVCTFQWHLLIVCILLIIGIFRLIIVILMIRSAAGAKNGVKMLSKLFFELKYIIFRRLRRASYQLNLMICISLAIHRATAGNILIIRDSVLDRRSIVFGKPTVLYPARCIFIS